MSTREAARGRRPLRWLVPRRAWRGVGAWLRAATPGSALLAAERRPGPGPRACCRTERGSSSARAARACAAARRIRPARSPRLRPPAAALHAPPGPRGGELRVGAAGTGGRGAARLALRAARPGTRGRGLRPRSAPVPPPPGSERRAGARARRRWWHAAPARSWASCTGSGGGTRSPPTSPGWDRAYARDGARQRLDPARARVRRRPKEPAASTSCAAASPTSTASAPATTGTARGSCRAGPPARCSRFATGHAGSCHDRAARPDAGAAAPALRDRATPRGSPAVLDPRGARAALLRGL